jgi:hypothetical protein
MHSLETPMYVAVYVAVLSNVDWAAFGIKG